MTRRTEKKILWVARATTAQTFLDRRLTILKGKSIGTKKRIDSSVD